MTYIKTQEKGNLFTIVLSRPPLNILNIAMMEEINNAIISAKNRILVIKAQGKAFSAGADVKEHLPRKIKDMLSIFHQIFYSLMEFPVLTVSIVNGPALGGGCELALGCDIVLASDKASFGQPEIKLGVFPPVAVALYPLKFPSIKIIDFILSGEQISSKDAKKIGMVTEVFSEENFEQNVEQYLNIYTSMSLSSLKITRDALGKIHLSEFEKRLKSTEEIYLNTLMKTEDAKEGLHSFIEKRKPVWRNK